MDTLGLIFKVLTPADQPGWVSLLQRCTPMTTTTVLIVLVVLLLFGGGWGYSRRGR